MAVGEAHVPHVQDGHPQALRHVGRGGRRGGPRLQREEATATNPAAGRQFNSIKIKIKIIWAIFFVHFLGQFLPFLMLAV